MRIWSCPPRSAPPPPSICPSPRKNRPTWYKNYRVALVVLDRSLQSVEVGGHVVEDHGEDEEVVVGGPGPGSPMGEVPVEEEEHSQQTLDVELGADELPLFGEPLLCVLCEDGCDFELVEPVMESLVVHHINTTGHLWRQSQREQISNLSRMLRLQEGPRMDLILECSRRNGNFILLMWGQQGGNSQGSWSEHFGGHGGGPGEFAQPTFSLVAIRGRCGAMLDQLQCLFIDVTTGQFHQSPVFGGNGGNEFMFQAPQGQWIDKLLLGSGDFVGSIEA